MNKKLYEVNILDSMITKRAFVRLIKNCVFKSKFNNFIKRATQRLYEKGFDKIKENNWIVEERKEMLEMLVLRNMTKCALRQWKLVNRRISVLEQLANIYDKNH